MAVVEFNATWSASQSRILAIKHVITERNLDRTSVASDDARRIEEVTRAILDLSRATPPDAAVVELPVGGAKSAKAIKGMAYAAATSIATLCVLKIPTTVISPFASKKHLTGDPYADKEEVILAVQQIWPDISWPSKAMKRGKPKIDMRGMEAIADALAAAATYGAMQLKRNAAKALELLSL
jgi:Holliday junction resolvasome RuvABC endonuclease subunit